MGKYLFDRELSWIDFNQRVLYQSKNPQNLVLERLKFMGIVCSNFDEFFMVRLANTKNPFIHDAYDKAMKVLDDVYTTFQKNLQPDLENAGIVRIYPQMISDEQHQFIINYFEKELFSLLTPIAFHENQPIPLLHQLSVYQIVGLKNIQSKKNELKYAVIRNPKNASRVISLPNNDGKFHYILLEDLIHMFINRIFNGYEIVDHGIFRLTRAADMTLDEEQDEDFAQIMSQALLERHKNMIVRIEYVGEKALLNFLKKKLIFKSHMIFHSNQWIDLKSISQIAFNPGFENLKRPRWNPVTYREIENSKDLWVLLKQKDILVHHPYQSFDAFIKFINQAAIDPDVLAIKQTLYRAAIPSNVVKALITAAKLGKQVVILVELKARFDEERNINWAEQLVDAGATVLYGIAGLKTHSKACLIIRREPEGIKRYVHLGTGNYNEKTAELYTDYSFFSSRDELGEDVSQFFNVITGFSIPTNFSKIWIAPYYLRNQFKKMIKREAIKSGKKGHIIAKMNSLVDPDIIQTLYQASQKGVKIQLIVRGICCLKPQIKKISENIEVISIVDQFLEHHRVYYFYNDGAEDVFLASADLMPRNLDRRLEIMFPIEDQILKDEIKDHLETFLKDNTNAWVLNPDGTYQLKNSLNKKSLNAQEYFCQKAKSDDLKFKQRIQKDPKPQRPKKR